MYYNKLKFYYRKLINRFSKYPIIYNNGFNFNKTLSYHKINLIIDIGAFTGTYALSLRRFGYKKKIVSFEPIKDSYLKLLKNADKDRNWIIHERVALGDKNKNIKIYVSKKKDSSSILKIKRKHINIEPESKITNCEITKMIKLDSIIENYTKNHICLLKIDTQGYEFKVLKGLGNKIKKFKLIQIELSLDELYEGQENWLKILKYLNKYNFQIWDIVPGFKNKKIGQLMQFDLILFKTK